MDVQVTINENNISPVNSFTINQAFSEHHTFECTFVGNVIQGAPGHHGLDRFKLWLGKTISIRIGGKLNFSGIICEIRYTPDSLHGLITAKGFSPTIILNTVIGHHESFSNLTFSQLIDKIKQRINNDLLVWEVFDAPAETIKYISQYNESYFSFLRRTCAKQGMLLYYTGQKLRCGKEAVTDEVSVHVTDCTELEIGAHIVPLLFETHAYNYSEPKVMKKKADSIDFTDPLLSYVQTRSRSVLQTSSSSPDIFAADSEAALNKQVETFSTAQSSALVGFQGMSTSATIGIGKNVKVLQKHNGGSKTLGTFLITEIVHTYVAPGGYSNNFKGISSKVKFLKTDMMSSPVAKPQRALVVAGHDQDPLQIGRVKVQMLWQKGSECTDWLQVMVLWAGNGDRGVTFFPHVNDEVMIGFKYGNPDLPFVIGSVVNGDRKTPVSAGIRGIDVGEFSSLLSTDTKDITSLVFVNGDDSGIVLNQMNNLVSIQSGVRIQIASGKDSDITITAKHLEIECKDRLNLQTQNIAFDINNDFNIAVSNTYTLQAEQISQRTE